MFFLPKIHVFEPKIGVFVDKFVFFTERFTKSLKTFCEPLGEKRYMLPYPYFLSENHSCY